MKKEQVKKIFNKFEMKLYDSNVGLNSEDYYNLNKLYKKIKDSNVAGVAFYKDKIRKLLKQLIESGVAYNMSSENHNYILNDLSVLPFVFANKSNEEELPSNIKSNKFRKEDQFSFYYVTENGIRVLVVSANKNSIMRIDINGGNKTIDYLSNVQYLMEIESITYNEALSVLLRVYNCDYPNVDSKLEPIINKYNSVLKSRDFFDYLINGCNRAKDNCYDIGIYERLFDLYLRACKEQSDSNFMYEQVPKRFVLKRK